MGLGHNPSIITDGLVLALDAANNRSYPGSGTSWFDLSGFVRTGTLTNGPIYDSGNNGSISFDGVDDYVQGNIAVTGNTNSTMLGFVNVTLNKRGAFFRNGSGNNGYAIGIGDADFDVNGNNMLMLFPQVRWITSLNTWDSGWQMVTMTLDNSGVPRAYKNTSLIITSSGVSANAATTSYYLGRNVGDEITPRAAQCKIANFMMYNRALSATEITVNFNALRSRFGI